MLQNLILVIFLSFSHNQYPSWIHHGHQNKDLYICSSDDGFVRLVRDATVFKLTRLFH